MLAMKLVLCIWFFSLAIIAAANPLESKEDAVLFADHGYRFTITSWSATPRDGAKTTIAYHVAFEIPKGSRFLLYVSATRDGFFTDSLASKELVGPSKGDVVLEFETDSTARAIYFFLWRGIGGGSPSGVICDGAIVSLPLKITPIFGR